MYLFIHMLFCIYHSTVDFAVDYKNSQMPVLVKYYSDKGVCLNCIFIFISNKTSKCIFYSNSKKMS